MIKGCWGSLQQEWLYFDGLDYAKGVEAMLHTFLPLATAGVVTRLLGNFSAVIDLSPLIVSISLCFGISILGNTSSSYSLQQKKEETTNMSNHDDLENKYTKTKKTVEDQSSLPKWTKKIHDFSLLSLPIMVNIWQNSTRPTSIDFILAKEICGIFFAFSISYITFCVVRQNNNKWALPHDWRGITAVTSAFITFQYRYLIPICTQILHPFYGRETQPPLAISAWFSCGVIGLVGTNWLRWKTNREGNYLLGYRCNDLCVLGSLVSVFVMGMALPFSSYVLLLSFLSIVSIAMAVIEKTVSVRFVANFAFLTSRLSI